MEVEAGLTKVVLHGVGRPLPLRTCRSRSWCRRRGRPRPASAAVTSAAGPTAAESARAAGRLGGQRPGPARPGAAGRSRGSRPRSTPAARRSPSPTSSCWAAARRSSRRRRPPASAVEVPFTPGRTDTTAELTDADSFAPLEPTADGFRNHLGKGHELPAEYLLVDRANLLTLSAPEMTVLAGRAAGCSGANTGQSTDRRPHRTVPGQLTNGLLYVNLLDMGDGVEAGGRGRAVRRHRPGQSVRAEVDRQPGRPGVRLELRAAGAGRGLRERRRAGVVRGRLRGRLETRS